MRSASLLLALLVGCTGAQSARVLAPGQTHVTGGMTRVTATEDGEFDSFWMGEVSVRHGLADKVDGGLRLIRSAGAGGSEALSMALLEPKLALTERAAATAFSAAFGVGLVWAEQGFDAEEGTIVLSPAVLIGHMVSPTTELVLTPRFTYINPWDGDENLTGFGLSLGARIGERTYGIYPSLDLLVLDGDGDSVTFITVGLGVGVGN